MERIYREYRDIAEFRLVYINEAHAADSSWPVQYAKEKGINDHENIEDRCSTAKRLMDEKALTIPCLVDGMENKVNRAYSAWPDRAFLIRTDGRLGVAGAQGPRGYKPAIEAIEKWLKAFRAEGAEPPLPDSAAPAGEDRDVKSMFPEVEPEGKKDGERDSDTRSGEGDERGK